MGTHCGTRWTGLLLAERDMFVLPVRHEHLDVGALANIGKCRCKARVEQVGYGLLRAHIDRFNAPERDVNADTAPVQFILDFENWSPSGFS